MSMKLTVCPVTWPSAHALATSSGSRESGGGPNIAILISLAALLVSIFLPLYLDSRQSPRVNVRISRLVHFDQQSDAIEYYVVSAINHGRSVVEINQVNISFMKRDGGGTEIFLTLLDFGLGPSLPYILNPYSNTYFGVVQNQVNEKIGEDLEKCRIYGSLNLSNGYRVISRRGLSLSGYPKLRKRHPHLRRAKLFIFAKEKSRWR